MKSGHLSVWARALGHAVRPFYPKRMHLDGMDSRAGVGPSRRTAPSEIPHHACDTRLHRADAANLHQATDLHQIFFVEPNHYTDLYDYAGL